MTAPTQPVSSQPPQSKTISISGFKVSGLRKKRTHPGTLRPFVVLSVDAKSKHQTESKPCSDDVSWDDRFIFEIKETSTLEFKVLHSGFLGRELGTIVVHGKDIWMIESKPQEFSHPLATSGAKVRSDRLTFSVVLGSHALETQPTANLVAGDVNQASEAADALTDPRSLALLSPIVDGASRLAPIVTAVYGDVQELGDFYAPIATVIGYLDRLVQIVETASSIHFAARATFLILNSGYQILKKQKEQNENIKTLATLMVDLFSWVQETDQITHKVIHLDNIVLLMVKQVKECALFIKEYAQQGFIARTLKSTFSSSIDDTISAFKAQFMSLHDQFQSGVLVSSFKLLTQVKVTMDNGIDELRKDLKRDYLAKLLPHVQSAKYDTSQQCLKGTRDILLDSILEWMSDEDVSPILWINGQAGAGKSTIAHTVASYADEACQLGACFFLHRDYAEKRNPHLIINTLAFQLAHFHHQIAEEIDQALARDPDLGYTLAVGDHFHKLIVQPLANLPSTSGQILILIDDLDALDAMDQQKITVRDAFLQCLADVGNQLPKFVKFFLTSRADWDISQTLSPLNTIRVIPLKLDDMETRGDLEKVAKKYIAKMHLKFPRLTNSWPGEEVINALVSKAAGLFIWMTTACNFILQRNPESRLQIVLGSKSKKNPEAGLDELYRKTILHHMDAQEDLDNEFFDNFRQTMGVIATLQSPLAAKTLDALLNLKVSTEDTINLLMAVLYIGKDSAIHPIHPSFIDFLSNKNRCQDDQLYIDVNFYHQQLAECCLDKMQSDSGLIRNICHLIDSSKFNEEIENLQVQLDIYVSKELRYACIFWAEHLSVTTPTQKLVAKLNIFVNVHMLHWLEAMSLLKEYGSALPALKKITNWYKSFSNKDEQFLQLLYDSQRFVQEFQIPISLSALHVYYSALPFTPEGTILFGHFQNNLNDSVKVLSGKNHKWSPCLQVFEGHSGTVNSVLFTPDGMKLISCSSDKTVCIWEVETGRPIVTYLEGHTDRIECMDISPDGTKLVTGSKDTTLQIWDLATNEHRPLEGHAAVVYGVAFSPDGNKIVSGSKDRTLCLWDVKTGKQIGQPLKGHTGVVSFVKFSPDGHFILSGSVDTTLCLWDAETGNQHGKPLKGHTASVIIGAFSPDGNIIASGSVDKTICLWNVKTSQQLGAPLIGHRMSVHALAFSPDGSKVVTGCGDTTLYCWDIITRKQQGSPLEGHTATINAVAFSPDGSKVVSASDDSTIRLWDATVSENAELLLVKHTGMVRSFAFSPDGGKIASTCMDNSIYLWDSATGKYLRKPFAGHMASICSIAFSPDGRKIVSGAEDSTIRIWNVSTGKQMGQSIQWLDSHELQSVAFSFEGSKIVACTKYIPHFFWEAKTGKFIGTLSEQQAGRLIAPTVQTPSQRLLTVGPTPHYITSNERPQKFPLDMHVNIHDGWVLLANKRLFWVPPTYRGNCFAVQDHMMVMGAGSGRVTIMDGSGPLEMMAETLR